MQRTQSSVTLLDLSENEAVLKLDRQTLVKGSSRCLVCEEQHLRKRALAARREWHDASHA